MKKALFLILIMFCISIVFAAPEVTISSVSVSDASINGGESGSISFTITNTGDRDITNVNVLLSSGLSIESQRFSYTDFEIGESRFVTTTYSAPVNMDSGSYGISISVDYNIGDDAYSNQAGSVVLVNGTDYLILSSYTSNLIIDEYTNFSINVTNQGDGILTDILLDLVLPDGFIPISGSQFYVDSLSVGESKVFSSNIFVEQSIEPDSFQFTLYKTADGFSDSDTLNVIVRGNPELTFSGVNLDPEIPISGTPQTISVQFENIGTGSAYNVVAELVLDQEVTGITTEYLGTLERDDLTSAIFDIYTPLTNELSGSVVVNYIDSNGVEYFISQDLTFDVIQSGNGGVTTYLIWGAIIVVVGYFVYTRYFKKKKK